MMTIFAIEYALANYLLTSLFSYSLTYYFYFSVYISAFSINYACILSSCLCYTQYFVCAFLILTHIIQLIF
jgi:hypothetical protein